MKFYIDFNKSEKTNDKLLIEKLGAYYVGTGSDKYPPFEELELDVRDFKHLEEILEIVDKELNDYYSAVISFNPPTLYLDTDV